MVQTERVERRAIGYRKHPLQIVERSKRHQLTSGVCCPGRRGSAEKNEAWSNRSWKDWTDRRTHTAVVWRSQCIAAGQPGGAATGRKERISAGAANSSGISRPDQCVDE